MQAYRRVFERPSRVSRPIWNTEFTPGEVRSVGSYYWEGMPMRTDRGWTPLSISAVASPFEVNWSLDTIRIPTPFRLKRCEVRRIFSWRHRLGYWGARYMAAQTGR